MRRYLTLFAITLGVAAALAVAARLPRREARAVPHAAERPAVELALAVGEGTVTPEVVAVPKDSEVRLTISNRAGRPLAIALGGYEDRVSCPALAPGQRWTVRFTAERPGDDFAWLVDGKPFGRLAVQGSHLVEGHR